MVSIANWAPPKRGKPSATTLRRRPSWPTIRRSKPRTKTFVETREPASRQTRAAALLGDAVTSKNTRPRTRCTVMAMDVEETATPADSRSEWKWTPETAKEKHAEKVREEMRRRRRRDGGGRKS